MTPDTGERDENGFLVPGTPVEWDQRMSGAHKIGRVLSGFNGLYGVTYLCRAIGWSDKYRTQVLETELRPISRGEYLVAKSERKIRAAGITIP